MPKRTRTPKPQPEPEDLPPGFLPRSSDLTIQDPNDHDSAEDDDASAGGCSDEGGDKEVPEVVRGITASELALLTGLARQLQRKFPAGMPTFTPEQIEQITGRMVTTYPTNWSIPGIGPCFDSAGLAAYWQVSPQTIRRRVVAGALFALKTDRGRYLYPEFQLDEDGHVIPQLFDLITEVRPKFPTEFEMVKWLIAWPITPSPVQLLRRGDLVAALARVDELVETIPDSDIRVAEAP
jgi:hypothetical protein